MKPRLLLPLLLLPLALGACRKNQKPEPNSPRFSIVSAQQLPAVYRLDTYTGEIVMYAMVQGKAESRQIAPPSHK